MEVREEVIAPGEVQNVNFEVAEEKAVKAIQRHSMLLNNSEKNPQIDEAYLLLGKARYYDQRFIPALEAFNYVLHKYPLSDNIDEARIWREKTNIRLEFQELAIRNLEEVLETKDLDPEDQTDALAMLAEAHLQLDAVDRAVAPLKLAALTTKEKNEEGRYWYILGQLYEVLGKQDSARYSFQRVVDLKRRSPRVYFVHARLNEIRFSENPEEIVKQLRDLAEDRENRPFLDKIFFELAEFNFHRDSLKQAIHFFNRALRKDLRNPHLESLIYQRMGDISFEESLYEEAGAYYDSTLMRLSQDTRIFRTIKKKRDNLDDVIFYENTAQRSDSILQLAALSEPEQLEFFRLHISKIKKKALDEAEPGQDPVQYFDRGRGAAPGVPDPASSFYFYNPTTVAYGKQEFFDKWGDRALVDNWRTQSVENSASDLDAEGLKTLIENDPRYDPATYLKKVPKETEALDSIRSELNFAIYQLGLIYRSKFEDNALAAKKLEFLISNNPEKKLLLPAKYNLYKIYQETGQNAKAQALKNDIIFQHPDSRYAAILQNPEDWVKNDNNPLSRYQELYDLFEKEEYEKVFNGTDDLIDELSGDELVPKLELLRAMASGRLLGLDAYRENLNYLALNYPQTEEGKKAQQLLAAASGLQTEEFMPDNKADSFKLVYPFSETEEAGKEAFISTIKHVLEQLEHRGEISVDVYSPLQDFVVVHDFESPEDALGFAERLSDSKKFSISRNYFYISNPNYRIAQIHKNIDTYLESLNKIPPNDVRNGKQGKKNK